MCPYWSHRCLLPIIRVTSHWRLVFTYHRLLGCMLKLLSRLTPQGSVLGPILFTMYTTPVGNISRKHGLNFRLYADDTQLYISFQPGVSVSKETAISCPEACIRDIMIWMTNNLLRLNDDKTELIVITTHSNTSQNQHIGINIDDSLITPSSGPPRNLGALFDSTCSLHDHVSKICKRINYDLYSIGKIRKYLDTPTAEI